MRKSKKIPSEKGIFNILEAPAGVEPASTALQAAV